MGLPYRRDYAAHRHLCARGGSASRQRRSPMTCRIAGAGMPFLLGLLLGPSLPPREQRTGACPHPDTLAGGRRSLISRGIVFCCFAAFFIAASSQRPALEPGQAYFRSLTRTAVSPAISFSFESIRSSSRSHGSRATQCLRRRLCQLYPLKSGLTAVARVRAVPFGTTDPGVGIQSLCYRAILVTKPSPTLTRFLRPKTPPWLQRALPRSWVKPLTLPRLHVKVRGR